MAQSAALRRASCRAWLQGRKQTRVFTSSSSRFASTAAAEAASRLRNSVADSVSVRRQTIDGNQVQKLSLTLGRRCLGGIDVSNEPPPTGTPLPPGYHLVYFTPAALETELGPDGSDATFNAAVPFTRRMWAGGLMSWPSAGSAGQANLRVGDEVEEHTRLVSATPKKSRSGGEMVLVEVEKELRTPRGCSVVDRRSWMFRPRVDAAVGERVYAPLAGTNFHGPTTIQDVPAEGVDQSSFPVRQLRWSAVGLFRFSALTFNGHKIHYSEEWCRGVEGHPAPVVHGPLNLISILDYWRDVHGNGSEPASISYRALSPVYAGETYCIRTKQYEQGAKGSSYAIVAEKNGVDCMTSEVLVK